KRDIPGDGLVPRHRRMATGRDVGLRAGELTAVSFGVFSAAAGSLFMRNPGCSGNLMEVKDRVAGSGTARTDSVRWPRVRGAHSVAGPARRHRAGDRARRQRRYVAQPRVALSRTTFARPSPTRLRRAKSVPTPSRVPARVLVRLPRQR